MDTERHIVLNNNSYLSIGIVILLICATLWIKDGQARSAAEIQRIANDAVVANSRVASDLANYKELQLKDSELLKVKIDGLTKVLQDITSEKWTPKDVRRIWSEFGALNPTLKLPQLP